MGGRSRNSRKKYRKTKPQRILIRCGFLGGRGWMSRAAQKRSPGRGSQRLHRALGGTRILLAAAPTAPPCFCRWQRSSLLLFESTRPISLALLQNKNLSVLAYVAVFWWARVDYASRAAKNSPLGCFYAVFCDSAAAVRIHPCIPFCKTDKTETPVPIGYRSSWWARVDSNHRS